MPIVIRDPNTIASIRRLMRETGEGFHQLLWRLAKAEAARAADEEKRRKGTRFALARKILETRAD
jgi:hypothetical protein